MKSFTDLFAWQKAHELSLSIYRELKDFPLHERYGLVGQMQRCSVSVSSNIAEGFGRSSAADKEHFYIIARGSIYELQSQLLLAHGLGYLNDERVATINNQLVETTRLLQGLINSTRKNR